MVQSTFLQIKELLDKNNVEYEHYIHAHVTTSQDAAAIRNTNLDDAAKAIVCKVEKREKNVGKLLPNSWTGPLFKLEAFFILGISHYEYCF